MQQHDLLDHGPVLAASTPPKDIGVPDGIRVLSRLVVLALQLGLTRTVAPIFLRDSLDILLTLVVIACIILALWHLIAAWQVKDWVIRCCQLGVFVGAVGMVYASSYGVPLSTDEGMVDQRQQQIGLFFLKGFALIVPLAWFHLLGRYWQLGYPQRLRYGFWRRFGNWVGLVVALGVFLGPEVVRGRGPSAMALVGELPAYLLVFAVYWEWRKGLQPLPILCSILWVGCLLCWWWTEGQLPRFEWVVGISWGSLLLGWWRTQADSFHESAP